MIGFRLQGLISGDFTIEDGVALIVGNDNTFYREIARTYGLCNNVETIKGSLKPLIGRNVVANFVEEHGKIVCEAEKVVINLDNYKYIGSFKTLDENLLNVVLGELAGREILVSGVRPSVAYDSPYSAVANSDDRARWFASLINTWFQALMSAGDKLVVVEDVVNMLSMDERREFSELLSIISKAHREVGFRFYAVVAGVYSDGIAHDVMIRLRNVNGKVVGEKSIKKTNGK